ncbi:hypothetical protein LJK88_25925 [Paenibacillus sp. P26]|nr:hypothetical protein LJK88_25925 [Paenibacillus sp. P26]
MYGVQDDLALSETFGAYGWHLGLRMMKWLTDWQAVRGSTISSCMPSTQGGRIWTARPTFYDGGLNPQWPYFAEYVRYVNRLSDWLAGEGTSLLLLVYPGALGYAGVSTPIEDVQQMLQEHQYDYDLVPADELTKKARVVGSGIELRNETYEGIVVPGLESATPELLEKLAEFAQAGIPVVFADRLAVASRTA